MISFDLGFSSILKLASSGQLQLALDNSLLLLHENEEQHVKILTLRLDLCLKLNRIKIAIDQLVILVSILPEYFRYYELLAKFYSHIGKSDEAVKCWREFVLHSPTSADAKFNLAYYLRLDGKSVEAISCYKSALNAGVRTPEEVHCNIATIYIEDLQDDKSALKELNIALTISPNYIVAIFNLGNLYERKGQFSNACECFKKVFRIDSTNLDAFARILDLAGGNSKSDFLLDRAIQLVHSNAFNESDKVNLLYSISCTLDKLKDFDRAFPFLIRANEFNKNISKAYDRIATEDYFDNIKRTFSTDYVEKNRLISEFQPTFVCGMFRSGSTLTEQMLGAHPDIHAAGELSFFPQLLLNKLSPFPNSMNTLTSEDKVLISTEYQSLHEMLKRSEKFIIDKRPDNFQAVGLIKLLFPKAKIIWTRRNILDNCLSIYFLRLGNSMSYSNSLSDIAHFYTLQLDLMLYWSRLFPDSICEVDYDTLVTDPKSEISKVLNWLNLEWDNNCLKFYEQDKLVQTASVSQVREKIYTKSSGRWANYEKHLDELKMYIN